LGIAGIYSNARAAIAGHVERKFGMSLENPLALDVLRSKILDERPLHIVQDIEDWRTGDGPRSLVGHLHSGSPEF